MAGFEVTMHGRFCTDPRGILPRLKGTKQLESSCLLNLLTDLVFQFL